MGESHMALNLEMTFMLENHKHNPWKKSLIGQTSVIIIFCTPKNAVEKMKRQAADTEEICEKDTSDKRLLSRLQKKKNKKLLKLNNEKTNNSVKERGGGGQRP